MRASTASASPDDLDASTAAEINAALLEHKVIFFRGQHDLDDDGQLAFARRLGTPTTAHPTVTSRGSPSAAHRFALRQGQQLAHRCHVRRPDSQGVAAARGHPARLRRHHDLGLDRGGLRPAARTRCARWPRTSGRCTPTSTTTPSPRRSRRPRRNASTARSSSPTTTRPSTRWCASTPRPAGACCCSAISSSGSSGSGSGESATLFNLLQARITKLENTIRWNWQPGDLAIWDNRATQHYAVADYDDQFRMLNRVTLAGDIPVDVDGQTQPRGRTATPRSTQMWWTRYRWPAEGSARLEPIHLPRHGGLLQITEPLRVVPGARDLLGPREQRAHRHGQLVGDVSMSRRRTAGASAAADANSTCCSVISAACRSTSRRSAPVCFRFSVSGSSCQPWCPAWSFRYSNRPNVPCSTAAGSLMSEN